MKTQFQAAFNLPNRFVTYYMGGSADQGVPPPISFERDNGIERSNTIATDINSLSFQEFVAPVRGFVPNSREGTRYMVANAELRIPLSRLANFRLNSKSLYNLELIPFLDVGTVWTEGNPFSDKNPTDTQILTNGPITVRLQTLKSPFLIGFGTGLRTNILNYSLRVDIAWGVDDSRLQSPLLMTSVGRNF
ncbi:MAG: BamA/TamA family outer membrane protein [Bacteroidota bacterium]